MGNDNRQAIAGLREQIDKLESLRQVLGDALTNQKKAELEAQLRPLVDTAGGAAILGDVYTAGGDFIGHDQILAALGEHSFIIGGDARGVLVVTGDGNTVNLAPEHVPTETLLQAYYRSLAIECRRLPLGVVDPKFARPLHEGGVSLADVYTDLDVVSPPRAEQESERAWGLRLARGEGRERTPLLQAIAEPRVPRIVLLGDPGSGKTTFINYLAYVLAETFLTHRVPTLPKALRGLLPVRLVLRDAAVHVPTDAKCGTAGMLWDALHTDVAERLGQATADYLCACLPDRLRRDGLFLLDGLDEVPEAGRRRKCLLEAVQELAASLPKERRILLTARPYAYADPQWQLPGFQVLALAPFSEPQVSHFVQRWYEAVRPAMGWDAATAQERGQRLARALRERPYLADLASRPLLLTLMATLHSSWGQLPEDRADLYEESVKLLLSRWQRGREVKGPDGQPMLEPGIEQALRLGEGRIRDALQKLAYESHARQRSQPEREEVPADIPLGDVLSTFSPLLPDDMNADVLLRYLDQRAGLLIGRREEVYAFPHRSFQEYLAVCHLMNQPDSAARLRDLVWEDPPWWREVFLLGVGKKRQSGLGDAVAVVNTLLPQDSGRVRPLTERHWQAAVLAGEALLELRLPEVSHGEEHYEALLERVRGWLVRLIEDGQLSPRERLTAGDVLGRVGDPRFDATQFFLPQRHRGEPEAYLGFVEIPAGPFIMGSSEKDKDANDDERPQHTLELPRFFMNRYPVTNAQFGLFVKAGGYSTQRYWTPEGWAWRQGAEADLSAMDERLRKDWEEWLARRPAEKRDRPFWWDDPRWGALTRPVVGVTWYEALAYCRWLEEQLRAAGALSWAPPGYTIRLPSEAEWEKAARGTDGWCWPWGNRWEDGEANTREAGLNETSAVGLFPRGASPYGLLDLASNTWQWTLTRWGKTSVYKPDYRYPYRHNDGREQLTGPDLRVVRGGSWFPYRDYARCAARLRFVPAYWLSDVGFRVVVSLATSES